MKKLTKFLCLILVVCLAFTLVACANDKPTGESPAPTPPSEEKPQPPTETLPTQQTIVDAITNVKNLNTENYDFGLNLNCNITISGISQAMNATYEGKYRFNKDTKNLSFYRKTSGLLLYDSVEYITTQNDNRIKAVLNDKGELKKTSVIPNDEEELMLVNKPFTALINALDVGNISNIQKSTKTDLGFKYQANLKFDANNVALKAILNKIANLGTSVDIKDVSFTNPQGGITVCFNLQEKNGQTLLKDYAYNFMLSFPFKGTTITLNVTYVQAASDLAISLPSDTGLITANKQIETELNTILDAINAVKVSDTYSIDFTAKNEFDPGFSTLATVDKYIARLYKNTNVDGDISRVDFNHSYEYKAHSETDGKETYKFTLGNTTDGKVYEIKRKGGNRTVERPEITVDSQFDYLTSTIIYNASEVDCIKKSTNKDGATVYNVYINATSAKNVMNKILGIVNSNDEEGVVDVDNYFNDENDTIKDADLTITIKDGKLVSAECKTVIKYYPTSGEHTEKYVTLTNEIILTVNDKLTDAQKYKAPEKPDGTFRKLSYIL